MNDFPGAEEYKYGGARALVTLHEYWMRKFVETWQEARKLGITAYDLQEPDVELVGYALTHVLSSSRNYMRWMCDKLNLADPEINPLPPSDQIEAQLQAYVDHLLDRWRLPLNDIPEEQAYQAYESKWGVIYCIDAMLEHAVMHPIRHTHQLERIMRDFKRI